MRIDLATSALAELSRAPAASPAAAAAAVPGAAAPDQAEAPDAQSRTADKVVNKAAIQDAVKSANEAVRQVATNLQFQTDESSGQLVVKVVDAETQKVLRQMPSEEMLSLAKAMDRMRGLMIQTKV
jgi:flagellar protein FlaG